MQEKTLMIHRFKFDDILTNISGNVDLRVNIIQEELSFNWMCISINIPDGDKGI